MQGLKPHRLGSDGVDELGSAETLLFEDFRLDLRGGVLYRSGQNEASVPVAIGLRAIRLLGLLAAHQGEVLSKDAIIRDRVAGTGGRRSQSECANLEIAPNT